MPKLQAIERGAVVDLMDYKADVLRELRRLRRLADAAVSQLDDRQFFLAPGDDDNSVAIILKHMAGNMRSRWREFLTTDGEKPDRNRDAEFELSAADTRQAISTRWREGWDTVFASIEALRASDFDATVSIRGEPHTDLQAINRTLSHYAYHVGQIIFVAKWIRGADWQSLSVPKGKSTEYNAAPRRYIDKRDT